MSYAVFCLKKKTGCRSRASAPRYSIIPRPHRSTLFPYTTLFRSLWSNSFEIVPPSEEVPFVEVESKTIPGDSEAQFHGPRERIFVDHCHKQTISIREIGRAHV